MLDLWTGNPFEFLNGTIPLALPASDATSDQGAVSAAESLLGDGGLRWCSVEPAQTECIDEKDLAQAVETSPRPTLVPAGSAFRQQYTLRGINFQADDLQIQMPDGAAIYQPTLRASSQPGQEPKLTIRFPEPVLSVTIFQPDGKQVKMDFVTRRPEPFSFVEVLGANGEKSAGAVRLGEPCQVTVPSGRIEMESSTEVVGSDWFDCLQVFARETVDVVRVCWRTVAASELADLQGAECNHNSEYGGHMGDVPMVLTSGSFYRVDVATSLQLDETASDFATLALCRSLPAFYNTIEPYRAAGGVSEKVSRYFRTAGPPQDLAPYVKWASPHHQSAGHWHTTDWVVRFNRSYIHRLYPDADNSSALGDFPYALEALLRDAEGRITRGFFHNWTTAGSATVLPAEGAFLDAVQNSPSPAAAPLPDDILEIRRWIHLTGSDLGVEDWALVQTAASLRRPRWNRQADGSVSIISAGNEGGSLFIARQPGLDNASLDCTVRLYSSSQGETGIVLGYASPQDYYLLRIRFQPEYVVQLVRIQQGAETMLNEAKERRIPPRPPSGPLQPVRPVVLRVSIKMRTDPAVGLEIHASVSGLKLLAQDAQPLRGSARVGFYARQTDAAFTGLVVTERQQELTPGARYSLLLTGGEGGPTQYRDDFFASGLGDRWVATASSWSTGDGLRPAISGARLQYHGSLEDAELVALLEMRTNDAVRFRLRVPDPTRSTENRTAYELSVVKTATGCHVTARASTDPQTVSHTISQGHAVTESATGLPLRVRLVGDTLRVWVFEQQVIDARLEDYTVQLSPTSTSGPQSVRLPIAWSGYMDYTTTAQSPILRSFDLRQAALLRIDFTASRYGSITELFESARADGDSRAAAGYDLAGFSADIQSLSQSQRELSDARLSLLAEQALFAAQQPSREAIEAAKQVMARMAADHDEELNALLLKFGAAFEAAPVQTKFMHLEAEDGTKLGFLLASPEALDPVLLGLPGSQPFGSTGRSQFTLSDAGSGTAVSTGWIASSDGTRVIIYMRAGQGVPTQNTANKEMAPVALDGLDYQLDIEYLRHHQDDQTNRSSANHIYDRPYILSYSQSGPERISGVTL